MNSGLTGADQDAFTTLRRIVVLVVYQGHSRDCLWEDRDRADPSLHAKAVIQRPSSNDDFYRNIHEMRLIKNPPSDSPSPASASIIIHQFGLIVDARIFWPLALHIQNLATATIKFVDFLPPNKQPH